MPLVTIVMGSKTDAPFMQETESILKSMGIDFETLAMSAHRNPERVRDLATNARSRGVEVIIAAAGGAAALPGAVKAYTSLPVIGVPLPTSEMKGIDSLHSIVMLPPGTPVACMGIGSWGARNAAYLAAEILAAKHPSIAQAYEEHRKRQSQG